MEIIARFPALPMDAPPPVKAAAEASPSDAATSETTVAAVRDAPSTTATTFRRHRNRMAGGLVRPRFPVRSVMVLFVFATVAWSFALRNDAARRQAAKVAQAAPAGVVK